MPDQSDAPNEPQLVASDPGTPAGDPRVSAIETNLMKVAEELGTWLGTAERKTTDFLAQRDITDHLVKIEIQPRGYSPRSKRGASVRVDHSARSVTASS